MSANASFKYFTMNKDLSPIDSSDSIATFTETINKLWGIYATHDSDLACSTAKTYLRSTDYIKGLVTMFANTSKNNLVSIFVVIENAGYDFFELHVGRLPLKC